MAKLTEDGSPVKTLINLGADAMDNMFDITISPPDDLLAEGTIGTDINIRADGFNPPAFGIKTYPISIKGVTYDRPATKLEGERKFDITFRLDANYYAYNLLAKWKARINEGAAGYVTNDLDESNLGSISVAALAKAVTQVEGDYSRAASEASSDLINWNFKQVWISNLDEPQYKIEGGDAIKIKATFRFGEYSNPINS